MTFLLLFCLQLLTNADLSTLRSLYNEASVDKVKAKKLLAIAEKNSSINSVFIGYLGAGKISAATAASYDAGRASISD